MLNRNIRVLEVLVLSTVLLITVYGVEGKQGSYTRSRIGKDPKYNGLVRANGVPAIITGTFFVVLTVVIGFCIFCCLVCRRRETSRTQNASLAGVSIAPVTHISTSRNIYYHNQACNVGRTRLTPRSATTEEFKNEIDNVDVPPSYSLTRTNTGNGECYRVEDVKHPKSYRSNTSLQHKGSIDTHDRIDYVQNVINTHESEEIESVHHEDDVITFDRLSLPNANITMLDETMTNDDHPLADHHENQLTNSEDYTSISQMTSVAVSKETIIGGGITTQQVENLSTSDRSPLPQINSAIPIQTARNGDYPVIDIIETI